MTLREVLNQIDLVVNYKGHKQKELDKRIKNVINGFYALKMFSVASDIQELWLGEPTDFEFDGTVVEYLDMIADSYYESEMLESNEIL